MGNGVRLFKVRTAVQYNSRATGQILLFVMAILTCRYCRDPAEARLGWTTRMRDAIWFTYGRLYFS